ncbi:MAG: hypothetical protein O7J95_00275, partial [Planctomycetota bacterium]|nr:hypothetical protein [Planctomycetota bacterium]
MLAESFVVRRSHFTFCAVGLSLALSAVLRPLQAADDDAPGREVRGGRDKIEALLHRARDLRAAGRGEEAGKLERQAAEVKARIGGSSGGEASVAKRLRGILRGLEQGIEALQALKRHDDAENLARIARGLKRELGEVERRPRAVAGERGRRNAERERPRRREGERADRDRPRREGERADRDRPRREGERADRDRP